MAQRVTADHGMMRRVNAVAVLRALRSKSEPATLTYLTQATGLARVTTEAALEGLLGDGWVVDVGVSKTLGLVGRPARRFRFRTEARSVVGLRVASDVVEAVVADLDGTIIERAKTDISSRTGRRARLDAMRQCLREATEAVGERVGEVESAVIATSGVVGRDGIVRLSKVIPEWDGIDLSREFERDLKCAITVHNDINLAGIAESWLGAAGGCESLVWLLAGRSNSAGVILDGVPLQGMNGGFGELGWISELGWNGIRNHNLSWVDRPQTRKGAAGLSLIESARSGDPAAVAKVEEFAANLAVGVASVAQAYDPECIVIGGSLAPALDVVLPSLTAAVSERCLFTPIIRASTLGDSAPSLGCVRVALDQLEDKLYATGVEATS